MPRLPYRLPRTDSGAQEVVLVLVVLALAASSLVTSWFAWRVGQPAGLGPGWTVTPAWRWLGLLGLVALLIVAGRARRAEASGSVLAVTVALGLAGLAAVGGGQVHSPWAWVEWRAQLGEVEGRFSVAEDLKRELDRAALLALAATLAAAMLARLGAGSQRGDVHGSARFATLSEVRGLGLLARRSGIVVGGLPSAFGNRSLFAFDRRHVGIFGPSGCGKTTCVVVPSLLSDRSSMVILDVKMELYAATADFRRRRFGHEVHAFAPTIDASWVAGYNPLADIPRGPEEVAHAQALALALVDPEGRTETLTFWQASAQALLTAAILHVLYTSQAPSLAVVQSLLAAPGSGIQAQLERMRDTLHASEHEAPWVDPETGNETATHPVVRLEAAKLLDLAEETRTSVLATARSYLTIFLDPVISANTSRHDFSLRGLGDPARPTSIYLILPARDIPRMRGFLRLFFQALGFHLTGSLTLEPDADGQGGAPRRRRLTLMLDELAALGRLDLIGRQIAFLRGYGIQVVAAVQTANQLYEIYGDRESVRGNLAYLLMFPSTEHKTAEEISKLLGDRTVYVETRGHTSGRTLLAPRRTRTLRDQRRALLTPDEVRRLPRGAALLLVTGSQPVLCEMRPWGRGE
jgi:type IV secretion system protein VirD4